MAAPTANDLIVQALLRHQIGLLGYSSQIRNEIIRLLDRTETDIKRQIRDALGGDAGEPLTPARLSRLERLLKGLRETRIGAWDDATKGWISNVKAVAESEPAFIAAIIEGAVPVDLSLELPAPAMLRSIATTRPLHGKPLSAWASEMKANDIKRIEAALRVGMTQGESLQELTRRVVGTEALQGRDGVTQATRAEAHTISRTAVMAVANEARRETAKLNEEILDGERFLSTLDSRTCQICGGYDDGKVYEIDEGPQPPIHPLCRCVRVMVVGGMMIGDRPMKSTSEKEALREFAKDQGLEKVPKSRKDVPHGLKGEFDEFLRGHIGKATGTVPARTTYEDFIRSQTKAVQDDILGPSRAALVRSNKDFRIGEFVDSGGKVKTLAQIAEQHASAFEAAGLDPVKFSALSRNLDTGIIETSAAISSATNDAIEAALEREAGGKSAIARMSEKQIEALRKRIVEAAIKSIEEQIARIIRGAKSRGGGR